MAVGPMVVSLTLKDNLSAALRTATGAVAGVANGMTTAFRSVTSQIFSLQTAIVGLATGATMRSLLNSFVASEKAAFIFDQTLRNTGRFTPEFSAQMQHLAAVMQSVGTQSDDAVLEAAKFLALSDKLATKDIPRATRAVADLAAATGTDMVAAARLLQGALEGDGAGIGRLRIGLEDTALKGKSAADMLTVIEAKVGGLDQKLGATTAGAMARAANAFDDLREKLGAFIAAVLKAGPLQFIQKFFEELGREIGGVAAAFGKTEDAKAWGTVLIGVISAVAVAIGSAIDGIQVLGRGLMEGLSALGLGPTRRIAELQAEMAKLNAETEAANTRMREWGRKISEGTATMGGGIEDLNEAMIEHRGFLENQKSAIASIERELQNLRAQTAIFGTSGVSAYEAIKRAIDGAKASIAGLGDTSEEAGKKALDAAQKVAAASAPRKFDFSQPAPTIAMDTSPWAEVLTLATEAAPAFQQMDASFAAIEARLNALPPALKTWVVAGDAAGEAMTRLAMAEADVAANVHQFRTETVATVPIITQAWRKVTATFKPQQAELDAWGAFFEAIAKMAEKAYTAMSDMGMAVVNALNSFVDKAIDALFEGEIKNMRDLARIGKEILNDLAKEIMKIAVKAAIGAAVSAVFGARGGMWEAGAGFAPLPRYAMGGIASEPALIAGEAGREAIVPLPGAGRAIPVHFTGRGGDGSGGTTNVHIAIHALDGPSVQSVLLSDDGQRAIHSAVVRGIGRSLRFRESVGGA